MYRLHGAIHAYGGTTVSARDTADSVITALSPAAWYRNATGVTSAGGFASQWDDYSGNARHLKQTTGTNQPAYAAGVFTFDGADNFMRVTGGFTLNQPCTFVLVLSQITWTLNDRLFDGNTAGVCIAYQTATTPGIVFAAGAALAQNNDLVLNTYGIVAAVANGASSRFVVNDGTATTGNAGANNPAGFALGSRADGAVQWSNIAVKEAVIFPSDISGANLTAVVSAYNSLFTVF